MVTVKKIQKRNGYGLSLNRALSKLGFTSRKNAETMIAKGHVTVNDKTIYDINYKVDYKKDEIKVGGKSLRKKQFSYIILNKPVGVVTTKSDEKGRKTVYDLLEINKWVFPVGRLDKDTSGLLLLTNDNQFSEKMTNPENKIGKIYKLRLMLLQVSLILMV